MRSSTNSVFYVFAFHLWLLSLFIVRRNFFCLCEQEVSLIYFFLIFFIEFSIIYRLVLGIDFIISILTINFDCIFFLNFVCSLLIRKDQILIRHIRAVSTAKVNLWFKSFQVCVKFTMKCHSLHHYSFDARTEKYEKEKYLPYHCEAFFYCWCWT